MTKLRIAENLTLPPEAVTQTFAIFGKRGSGKSNTGVVLAEEMFKVGAPFVILDPVSAWWGLKSSFDGKGPGLAVYVFGGPHQDLPLEPHAGELMARVFIEHRIPMVLDMKGWSGGDRARFVTDFALWLLGHNDRVPVHVFIEEADAFVPQRPFKGEERMLGAMDRLVRWGRQEGIGATLITQRSAKANKDVTTQAETLIAHRTTGPQDRDAIDAWVRYHAGGEERQEILSTLPTLADGTAWVWSPEWLDVLRMVKFRRRETYDSASTPKLGEERPQPKQLAEVDIEKLRGQLTTTIEKAKADDPKELRRKIADLERQLKARPSTGPDPVAAERAAQAARRQAEHEWAGTKKEYERELSHLRGKLSKIAGLVGGTEFVPAPPIVPSPASRPAPARPRPVPEPGANHHAPAGRDELTPTEKAVLDAAATFPSGATRQRISIYSGRSIKSSSFQQVFSGGQGLPAKGLLQQVGDRYVPTEAGRTLAVATSAATVDDWLRKLMPSEAKVLRCLVDAYPERLTRQQVSERTGQSIASSSFQAAFPALRDLELIEGREDFAANAALMG